MTTTSTMYRLLRAINDAKAVTRAAETGSVTPITNRIGRKLIGRTSGRLSNLLFPPQRRRR